MDEAGRIELVKEAVDLKQLVENTLNDYQALVEDKGISLKSWVDPILPGIKADPRRLEQILANLLSNAVKFTREGGQIEVGTSQADAPEVIVWVKDTGIGILADEIKDLFKKYHQTTSGKIAKQKGTGLGLVICKMIVEAHGGRIWVESREGNQVLIFASY